MSKIISRGFCIFCGSQINYLPYTGDSTKYECPTCGLVYLSGNVYKKQDNSCYEVEDRFINDNIKYLLQAYFRHCKEKNLMPEKLTYSNLYEIVRKLDEPTNLLDKIKLVLNYLYKNTNHLYQKISIDIDKTYPLFYCINRAELWNILCYLALEITLTPKGIDYIQKLGMDHHNSKQCFVAMWFDNEIENLYTNVIDPAVRSANYIPRKINDIHHTDIIDDRIISEIRQSKFIIADLTGYRGGVYFEAGFAYGLGIKVIYTCNKEWEKAIQKECGCIKEGVHFDVNHRSIIFWEYDVTIGKYIEPYSKKDLKELLETRIKAVII